MFKLHHVNICATDVPGLEDFYRRAFPLEKLHPPPLMEAGAGIPASFLDAGDPKELQLHLANQRVNLGFERGQFINPLDRGHIAFRCDDIEAIKARLEANQIPYSEYGEWAVKGWYQVFVTDPVGTVVEVHQVL